MKKEIKDYQHIIQTADVDERDRLIEELYKSEKKYYYTDKDKSGLYTIAWNDDKR